MLARRHLLHQLVVISHLLTRIHRVFRFGGHLLPQLRLVPRPAVSGHLSIALRRVNVGLALLVVDALLRHVVVGELRAGHLLVRVVVLLGLVEALVVAVEHLHRVLLFIHSILAVLHFGDAAPVDSDLGAVRAVAQRGELVLLVVVVVVVLLLLLFQILLLHLVVRGRYQLNLDALKRHGRLLIRGVKVQLGGVRGVVVVFLEVFRVDQARLDQFGRAGTPPVALSFGALTSISVTVRILALSGFVRRGERVVLLMIGRRIHMLVVIQNLGLVTINEFSQISGLKLLSVAGTIQ